MHLLLLTSDLNECYDSPNLCLEDNESGWKCHDVKEEMQGEGATHKNCQLPKSASEQGFSGMYTKSKRHIIWPRPGLVANRAAAFR